jgi:hypothetical protein
MMTKSIQQILEEERKKGKLSEISDSVINHTLANQAKAKDPEWLKLKKIQNADPIIKAKRKASMPDQSGENNPFFGKSHTTEAKTVISKKKKGQVPSNKGTKHKEEDILKMRKPRSEEGKANMRKPRTQMLTCPHCGKTGASGNMARYHMDNCKLKG